MTIGGIIRRLRLTSGMTPAQLGAAAEVDSSYIRKLEKGHRHDITLDTAKRLAEALGVSPGVFLEAEVPRDPRSLLSDAEPQTAQQLRQWSTSLQTGIDVILEENQRLRLLADVNSDGVVVLDEGRVLFANKALIEMLGSDIAPNQAVDFDALHLGDLMDYIAPGSLVDGHHQSLDLKRLMEDFGPGSLKREIVPFTLDLLRSDGSHVTVWARGVVMQYQGRRVRVAILRDVFQDRAFHLNVPCPDRRVG